MPNEKLLEFTTGVKLSLSLEGFRCFAEGLGRSVVCEVEKWEGKVSALLMCGCS